MEADTNKKKKQRRKDYKRLPQTNEKTARNQALQQKSVQMNEYQGCSPSKTLGTIITMEKERIQKNGPEEKKVDDDALGLTSKRGYIILYLSKKEWRTGLTSIEDREDVLIRGHKDNIKKSKERQIAAARDSTDIKTKRITMKRKQTWGKTTVWIHDFAVPVDHRVKIKEIKMVGMYLDLVKRKLWNMRISLIVFVAFITDWKRDRESRMEKWGAKRNDLKDKEIDDYDSM